MLFMHIALCAFALDWLNAGKSIPAKIAMIAMTTSNSINVKARQDAGQFTRLMQKPEDYLKGHRRAIFLIKSLKILA